MVNIRAHVPVTLCYVLDRSGRKIGEKASKNLRIERKNTAGFRGEGRGQLPPVVSECQFKTWFVTGGWLVVITCPPPELHGPWATLSHA